MPENEHTALRTYLLSRGLAGAEVQAAVGTAAAGRKRHEVERAVTTWLQNRPKG